MIGLDNHEIEFATGHVGYRSSPIDIFFQLDAIGCHFKRPGKDQSHGKPKNKKCGDKSNCPLGQRQGREHDIGDLHEQPPRDAIHERNAEHVAPLEFLDDSTRHSYRRLGYPVVLCKLAETGNFFSYSAVVAT